MQRIPITRFSVFFLLFLFLLSACKISRIGLYNSSIEMARAEVNKIKTAGHFPGIAVAVAKDGNLIWSEGFGYADLAKKEEIRPDESLFRIGSISKTLTASGLAKLEEAGKIKLDTFIQAYVPDFPRKRFDVTLRQLGGHLAGIRHYRGNEMMSKKHYRTVKEGLVIFANDTLLFEPERRYSYSSYGWNLLSAAMEGASQERFLEYMDREVFDPLDMENTHPDDVTIRNTDRVRFYILKEGKPVVAPAVDNSYKWAGGGFISTAEDLIVFATAHLTEEFLKRETIEKYQKSQTTSDGEPTNYGIGWRSGTDDKGRKWVGHSGGSVGGTSFMAIFPKEQLVVVTLVNLSGAEMRSLPMVIADHFLK